LSLASGLQAACQNGKGGNCAVLAVFARVDAVRRENFAEFLLPSGATGNVNALLTVNP